MQHVTSSFRSQEELLDALVDGGQGRLEIKINQYPKLYFNWIFNIFTLDIIIPGIKPIYIIL